MEPPFLLCKRPGASRHDISCFIPPFKCDLLQYLFITFLLSQPVFFHVFILHNNKEFVSLKYILFCIINRKYMKPLQQKEGNCQKTPNLLLYAKDAFQAELYSDLALIHFLFFSSSFPFYFFFVFHAKKFSTSNANMRKKLKHILKKQIYRISRKSLALNIKRIMDSDIWEYNPNLHRLIDIIKQYEFYRFNQPTQYICANHSDMIFVALHHFSN